MFNHQTTNNINQHVITSCPISAVISILLLTGVWQNSEEPKSMPLCKICKRRTGEQLHVIADFNRWLCDHQSFIKPNATAIVTVAVCICHGHCRVGPNRLTPPSSSSELGSKGQCGGQGLHRRCGFQGKESKGRALPPPRAVCVQ